MISLFLRSVRAAWRISSKKETLAYRELLFTKQSEDYCHLAAGLIENFDLASELTDVAAKVPALVNGRTTHKGNDYDVREGFVNEGRIK